MSTVRKAECELEERETRVFEGKEGLDVSIVMTNRRIKVRYNGQDTQGLASVRRM